MASLPYTIGALVAVGLVVGVGAACRSSCGGDAPAAPLAQQVLAGSVHSLVLEQRVAVARDAAAWAELWGAHEGGLNLPGRPAPEVDFERDMVVAVFLGQRPSGGFAVSITAVTPAGEHLDVAALEDAPGPNQPVTLAMTAPMQAVTVPRAPGEPRLLLERITAD